MIARVAAVLGRQTNIVLCMLEIILRSDQVSCARSLPCQAFIFGDHLLGRALDPGSETTAVGDPIATRARVLLVVMSGWVRKSVAVFDFMIGSWLR